MGTPGNGVVASDLVADEAAKQRSYLLTIWTKAFSDSENEFPPGHELKPVPGCEDKVEYLIYQPEVCPSTGRLHYQAYIEMASPQRISGVARILGIEKSRRCYLVCRRRVGSRDGARDYCRKERTRRPGGSPREWGAWTPTSSSKKVLARKSRLVRRVPQDLDGLPPGDCISELDAFLASLYTFLN